MARHQARVVTLLLLAGVLLLAPLALAEQRPGITGELGKTYLIGRDLHITLKSAEFSATRAYIGEWDFVPGRDQKLLIIHYSLQNTLKQAETYVNSGTIRFTVVDAANSNHEYVGYVGLEGKGTALAVSLKPAQKIDVYTVFVVPAPGVVPKLIVLPYDDADPVIRYDLRGKVKPLRAPYADPQDKSGVTALPRIPAQAGAWYGSGRLDIRLDRAAYTTDPMPEDELEEGQRYLVLTMTLKNQSVSEMSPLWDELTPCLLLDDEETPGWNQRLLLAKYDREAGVSLKPGGEVQVRYYWAIPADVPARSITFYEPGASTDDGTDGREFVYDLGGVR